MHQLLQKQYENNYDGLHAILGQLEQLTNKEIYEKQNEEYNKNFEALKNTYRNIFEINEKQKKLNEKKAEPKDKQKVDLMSQMYQLWLKELEDNKKRKMSEAGPSNTNADHSNQRHSIDYSKIFFNELQKQQIIALQILGKNNQTLHILQLKHSYHIKTLFNLNLHILQNTPNLGEKYQQHLHILNETYKLIQILNEFNQRLMGSLNAIVMYPIQLYSPLLKNFIEMNQQAQNEQNWIFNEVGKIYPNLLEKLMQQP
ncbi:unnamed protein product [Meloidogyne enterolobii]|uniref:Uncharacterized protein n=2 Tax=Meloidogyne enterolobii TaxID=390850 RepID=A0A6V7XVN2_MELEN|nr:unnamed protein product [Meloidogyne enterolobii]